MENDDREMRLRALDFCGGMPMGSKIIPD